MTRLFRVIHMFVIFMFWWILIGSIFLMSIGKMSIRYVDDNMTDINIHIEKERKEI